jgi:alpha-L-rhamnosidase
MNSYNHYAYGAVADWIFSRAAGIKPDEIHPGYERAIIAPTPSKKLGRLSVSYKTRHGEIVSKWEYRGDTVEYTVTVPTDSTVVIDGESYEVAPGTYHYTGRAV